MSPSKARTFCAERGCSELVESGDTRCTAHRRDDMARDRSRRGSAYQRGYGGAKWQRFRERILKRDGYLCQRCLPGTRLAKIVDHIVPVRVAPERFFDASNAWSLCRECDNEKKAEEEQHWPLDAYPPREVAS